MKRKQFLACMLMVAMAATVAVPSFTAEAAGLTQATDATYVNYGTISSQDRILLEELFDLDYYKEQNPELVELFGDEDYQYFNHFAYCGIFEGRTCNASFDPAAYASAYTDLDFGTDIMSYYKHYILVGSKENRDLTTIEACANAGITVETLCGDGQRITPQAYAVANSLGLRNLVEVQNVVNNVLSSSNHKAVSVSSSNSDNIVVIVPKGDTEAMELCKGLTKVGDFTFGTYDYRIWLSVREDGINANFISPANGGIDINVNYGEYTGEKTGAAKIYVAYHNLGLSEIGTAYIDLIEIGTYDAEIISDKAMYDYKFKDEYGTNRYVDQEGTAETVYTYSLDVISQNENGIVIATGVYNEDNQFAVYHEYNLDFSKGRNNSSENSVETANSENESVVSNENIVNPIDGNNGFQENTTADSTNTEITSDESTQTTSTTEGVDNTSSTENTDNISSSEGTDNTNNE